jgi:hypothetical protein
MLGGCFVMDITREVEKSPTDDDDDDLSKDPKRSVSVEPKP